MNIKFKFSYQLQKALSPRGTPPSPVVINKNIKVLTKFWTKNGDKIERAFKKYIDLSFTEDSITCYLNTKSSFSDPLTVLIQESNDMKDTLIHELIHQLLIQNEESNRGFNKKFDAYFNSNLFKGESWLTRAHIYLHALHLLLTRDLFPKREKSIINYSKAKDYVRSWEIVEKMGAKNILTTYF